MQAAEIQRQGDCAARLQQREFRRAANVNQPAADEHHAGVARMHGHHAAIRYVNARRGHHAAIRRNAAFDGNILSLDSADHSPRHLLRAQRHKANQQDSRHKQQPMPQPPMGSTGSASGELGSGKHQDQPEVAYTIPQ